MIKSCKPSGWMPTSFVLSSIQMFEAWKNRREGPVTYILINEFEESSPNNGFFCHLLCWTMVLSPNNDFYLPFVICVGQWCLSAWISFTEKLRTGRFVTGSAKKFQVPNNTVNSVQKVLSVRIYLLTGT